MKQKDKQLLLKELCARLPYGVKVVIEFSKDKYSHVYDLREIDNDSTAELRQQVTVWNYGFYSSVISYPLIDCRPYLRPMSSMTEDEDKEYNKTRIAKFRKARPGYRYDGWWEYYDTIASFDYLNTHHFDYRGLISKGLAIEVTKENNPYKE